MISNRSRALGYLGRSVGWLYKTAALDITVTSDKLSGANPLRAKCVSINCSHFICRERVYYIPDALSFAHLMIISTGAARR